MKTTAKESVFLSSIGFGDAMERIKKVTGCRTQVQLAEYLDIRQSSISDAKRRCSIPSAWLLRLMFKTNTNPLWILHGDEEPKFRIPSTEAGQVLNVKELREKVEAEIRAELDNLHAEDLIYRLKEMGLRVQVMPE
jgi:hypothetical protein